MPKKGVVPPQFRPGYVPKGKRGRRSLSRARQYYARGRSYASRGRSFFQGGGLVSKAGMAIGLGLGLEPEAQRMLTAYAGAGNPMDGAKQALNQAFQDYTGINMHADYTPTGTFDIMKPIVNIGTPIAGALLGKALGRGAEKLLSWIGIKTPHTLHEVMG